MTFRLAVAQRRLIREPDSQANLAQADPHPPGSLPLALAQAVELTARARLILFTEGAPGPQRPGTPYDAEPAWAQAAADHKLAVCWSRMERSADGYWRLVVYVHAFTGQRVVRYERSHPATLPPEQTGAWVAPGDALCSELWVRR